MIKKYTGNYCQSLLPTNMHLDLKKSQIKNLDEFIDVKQKVYLICEEHGKIEKPVKTYDLARYGRDYKSITPCSKCDPSNCNHMTFDHIKTYVESKDRFGTHGNLFELLTDEKDISILFRKKANKNRRHVPIRVKTLLSTSINKKDLLINTTYDKFRKNIGLKYSSSPRESWLSNLIGFFSLKYGLSFESEKSFDGLTGIKDGKLSFDYFFPDLNKLVEVDGIQHKEPSYELDRNQAIEKFNERKIHDNLKDAFTKNSGIELIRLNAFKSREGRLYSLSEKESHEKAFSFVNKLFHETHNCPPPTINESEILDYFSSNDRVLKRCKEKVQMVYGNNFKFVKRLINLNSHHSTFLLLKCKRNHVFKISESKLYLDKEQNRTSSHVCFICNIQNKLSELQNHCMKNGYKILNINKILESMSCTIEKPVDYHTKLKKSEIKLLICKAENEEKTIIISLTGFKIEKLNWHFRRLEGKIKQKAKTIRNRRPHRNIDTAQPKTNTMKKIILVNNYDKNQISNYQEYVESKILAQKHNDQLRLGNNTKAPELPQIHLKTDNKLRDKSFKNIKYLFEDRNDFKIVSHSHNFIDNQSYLALKHSVCGCVSFIRAFEVCNKIKSNKKLTCQFKPCYEMQTGIKLATTRNKREKPPHNKKHEIQKEVTELSEGVLIPLTEPTDVRSNFQVQINCKGSRYHKRIMVISSHDNYVKRGSYEKIAKQIRNDIELDKRIKIL